MNFSKIKTSLAAIAFIFAIVAAFAFEKPSNSLAEYYFSWDGTDTGAYISNPTSACPELTGTPCAMGFNEEDVDTSVNPPILKSYAAENPDDYDIAKRYQED